MSFVEQRTEKAMAEVAVLTCWLKRFKHHILNKEEILGSIPTFLSGRVMLLTPGKE